MKWTNTFIVAASPLQRDNPSDYIDNVYLVFQIFNCRIRKEKPMIVS